MPEKTTKLITLGIETSCDDTGIAVLCGADKILSSKLSSQINAHTKYGGVVPELASRMHQETIMPLLDETLEEAGIKNPEKQIDIIAVTAGPGLIGSLMVGVMTAKGLARGWNKPIIGVNHLEGHLFANIAAYGAEKLKPPFISVIISGGHTELILVKNFGDYTLLGTTRDDAAGEAYDKVAKILGLGYPGGPVIDKLAHEGDENAYELPLPLAFTKKIEFSFSGLKTAAVNTVKTAEEQGKQLRITDFCASFQKAVTDCLCKKIDLAAKQTGIKNITLSGGVAANSGLREKLEKIAAKRNWNTYFPPRSMCTDNAAMIAAAGFDNYLRGINSDMTLSPNPGWSLWD